MITFLHFLSFLIDMSPCLFNIFIQTKVNLYIKTFSLNLLHFHLIRYYSKLSSYANAKMLTKSDEVQLLELDGLVIMKLGVSPTARFYCIGVIQLIITENGESCAVLFVFFISKFAIVEVEVLAHVVQHSRKVAYFGHVFHVGRKWSICEDISLTRMWMNIDEQFQLIFHLWVLAAEVFKCKLSKQFNFSQARLTLRITICKEETIHVFALGVASVIATNNAIRIHHWNEPKFQLFSKLFRDWVFLKQKVDQTMYDKRWICFTWMLSSNYQNSWFIYSDVAIRIWASNFD